MRILLVPVTSRLLSKEAKIDLAMLPMMFGGDWMHATTTGLAKLGLSARWMFAQSAQVRQLWDSINTLVWIRCDSLIVASKPHVLQSLLLIAGQGANFSSAFFTA